MPLEKSREIAPEGMKRLIEPKWKQHPGVHVSGGESKVQCCKDKYCIGTRNIRSMNQGKLDMVKQEMSRVNINILRISALKWTKMGEFNSDDHNIYYCGQESLRRNGVALIINKKVQNAVATAAKLLQSCLTLCNPTDGSLPGSPLPGILQSSCLEYSMDRGAW